MGVDSDGVWKIIQQRATALTRNKERGAAWERSLGEQVFFFLSFFLRARERYQISGWASVFTGTQTRSKVAQGCYL